MSQAGKIRIIAGDWRGRRIEVLDSPGLRPTPDRIRETLFNWIQNEIQSASCLDLFAGTGALGFEALSRGASRVVMVESDKKLFSNLEKQAELLNSRNHQLHNSDALNYLKKQSEQFDFIFLDPPFNQDNVSICCNLIQEQSLLHDKGMIYIESEQGLELPAYLDILKETKAGQVRSVLAYIT